MWSKKVSATRGAELSSLCMHEIRNGTYVGEADCQVGYDQLENRMERNDEILCQESNLRIGLQNIDEISHTSGGMTDCNERAGRHETVRDESFINRLYWYQISCHTSCNLQRLLQERRLCDLSISNYMLTDGRTNAIGCQIQVPSNWNRGLLDSLCTS